MLAWLDFFTFFFWILLFLLLFNNTSFLGLLLFSEFVWILLYCFVVLLASMNDDLLLLSFSFYFLGLAGVEFSFGLLLIIMFKQYNFSLNFTENTRNLKFLNTSNWL